MKTESDLKYKILQFGERAISELMEEGIEGLTPQRTDNYLSFLSGYSAQLELEYGELVRVEPIKWIETRKNVKTNNEAERIWKASPEGQRMLELKYLLKAVDKIISACKKRMDRLNRESYNNY